MPLPKEYSCRIKEPNLFKKDSFRRIHLSKGLDAIIGKLKGKITTTTQSLRYKKAVWSKDRAKNHCSKKGGRFEASLNLMVASDHMMLHYAWKKLEKKEDWYGWTKKKVVKEHAKIVDILRNEGKKMTKKSKLDELSWEYEKTIKMLTPSDIPNLLKANKKSIKLEDITKINKENLQELGFTALFETHNEIHKQKEVDKKELLKAHSLVVDEYKRREMIHPYWSELDKVY